MNKLIIAVFIIGVCTAANFKCPEQYKNNKVCTREYMPVCGLKLDVNNKYSQTKATYGNKCTACSEEGVEFYAEGSCDEYPKNATFCHPDASESKVCTREFFPVCGLFDDSVVCVHGPCGSNYSNKCTACINKQVAYFLPGFCHSQEQYSS